MLGSAEAIRERRVAENWSRNELAARSGVAYGTLIKFERMQTQKRAWRRKS